MRRRHQSILISTQSKRAIYSHLNLDLFSDKIEEISKLTDYFRENLEEDDFEEKEVNSSSSSSFSVSEFPVPPFVQKKTDKTFYLSDKANVVFQEKKDYIKMSEKNIREKKPAPTLYKKHSMTAFFERSASKNNINKKEKEKEKGPNSVRKGKLGGNLGGVSGGKFVNNISNVNNSGTGTVVSNIIPVNYNRQGERVDFCKLLLGCMYYENKVKKCITPYRRNRSSDGKPLINELNASELLGLGNIIEKIKNKISQLKTEVNNNYTNKSSSKIVSGYKSNAQNNKPMVFLNKQENKLFTLTLGLKNIMNNIETVESVKYEEKGGEIKSK